MTPYSSNLDSSLPYTGLDSVTVGNGALLSFSAIGSCHLNMFTNDYFTVQRRVTRGILARGRRKHGLYIMDDAQLALIAARRPKASFELWHSRLGHVSYDVISFLNKIRSISVTALLPNPDICDSCEKAKSKRMPFVLDEKHSLSVLDIVHCD